MRATFPSDVADFSVETTPEMALDLKPPLDLPPEPPPPLMPTKSPVPQSRSSVAQVCESSGGLVITLGCPPALKSMIHRRSPSVASFYRRDLFLLSTGDLIAGVICFSSPPIDFLPTAAYLVSAGGQIFDKEESRCISSRRGASAPAKVPQLRRQTCEPSDSRSPSFGAWLIWAGPTKIMSCPFRGPITNMYSMGDPSGKILFLHSSYMERSFLHFFAILLYGVFLKIKNESF